LARGAGLVSLFPGTAGPLAVLVALVFGWGVKQAVIEPIGMTALMQVFFKVTEGQTPNPEWEGRLEKLSGKFRELKGKAATWGTAKPEEPAAPQGPAGPQQPASPRPSNPIRESAGFLVSGAGAFT